MAKIYPTPSPKVGAIVNLERLQGEEYYFTTDSQEVREVLETIGYQSVGDMRGVVVKMGDGEYTEVWVTDWSRPYNLGTPYERVM